MITAITHGVRISVETFFQHQQSSVLNQEYIFAYHITIENNSNQPLRLLRRHWFIFDSNGLYREVEGDGVVGVQPVIKPGEAYDYFSNCNLRTDMGKMKGNYTLIRLSDNKEFKASIPEFELIAPAKMN